MDDRQRSLEQTLDYAIAIGRFDSAFEASERLHPDDRQVLLRQMADRIAVQLTNEISDLRTVPTAVPWAV
jgi:hypothetical protein